MTHAQKFRCFSIFHKLLGIDLMKMEIRWQLFSISFICQPTLDTCKRLSVHVYIFNTFSMFISMFIRVSGFLGLAHLNQTEYPQFMLILLPKPCVEIETPKYIFRIFPVILQTNCFVTHMYLNMFSMFIVIMLVGSRVSQGWHENFEWKVTKGDIRNLCFLFAGYLCNKSFLCSSEQK